MLNVKLVLGVDLLQSKLLFFLFLDGIEILVENFVTRRNHGEHMGVIENRG